MTVRIFIDVAEPARTRAIYTLGVLFDGIGLPIVQVASAADADVVYARDSSILPAVDVTEWDAAAIELRRVDGLPVMVPRGSPTLDIVFSTYLYLTGRPERDQARDPWGVPICDGGSFREFGLLETPVVSRYAEWLAAKLPAGLAAERVRRWPNGKRCAVVLSHDIDAPFSSILPSYSARNLGRVTSRGEWTSVPRAVASVAKAMLKYRSPDNDPNLRIRDWVDVAHQLGGSTTFYVAVRSSIDPEATNIDVSYDFRHPALLGRLREAAERGAEIGVHASVAARRSADLMAQERQWLASELGGHVVSGVRHHYWAVDPELPERTSWLHAAAGYEYDSSLGSNDVPCFRRGMAWPYYPFDREREQQIPVLQIPPTLMDGGIFYRAVASAEGEAQIRSHFAEVFARGGAVVLDWHMEQMNPARLRGAGPALLRVLSSLAADSGIFWTSARGMVDWWKERQRRIDATRH